MLHLKKIAASFLIYTLTIGTALATVATVASDEPAPPETQYRVVNLMPAFWKFWGDAQHLDVAAQAALFEKEVGSRYPLYYAPQVIGLDPQQPYSAGLAQRYSLVHSLVRDRMDLVRNLSESIGRDLPKHEARFRQAFPDLAYDGDIVFMYSLGGFDGGTRTVGGKTALLFGLDMMAYVYGKEVDPAPFFHHELFHVYHAQFPGAGTPGPHDGLLGALWREGLATYVAHSLNPQAAGVSLFGLPRSTPQRVHATLPMLARQLHSVLGSQSETDYRMWFNGSKDDAVPPARAGYIIGYLVAERLAHRYTLRQLAHMPVRTLKPEIEAELRRLANQE